MHSYLEEYQDAIKKKDIIVGYWIEKEIDNLVEDIHTGFWKFDTTEVERRIKFQEQCCLQSKAPYYNKPISLLLWQKAWWEGVYAFYDRQTGLRRFTEGLLEVARKNGKSTMFASDAMFDLFIGEGGNDYCCASNDDGQARLIWEEIGGMRGRLDPKKSITSQNLTHIRNDLKSISITRLSSKTQNKDGRNYSKVYLDESHDIKELNGNSEIAEACWRSMSAKEDPLFLNCTTNGFNRDCYLDVKIAYAKKVIAGEIDDPHFIGFLYEQDSEAEVWNNKESWHKANPSLKDGIKKIYKLERDVETAKHDVATRVHLLTKDFDIPQSSAESWLILDDYDYPTEHFDLDDFRNGYCLGYVDLSATTDLTSAKILLVKDDKKYVFSHYWTLQSKLEDIGYTEAGADYIGWAKADLITIHDGTEINLEEVADWFYWIYKKYNILPYRIGYDQRYAKVFLDRLEQFGFESEIIMQGRALSGAMKLTEADFKAQKIYYNNNPVDKWCLSNCCAKVDNMGEIQPVKSEATRRIDGAVTFIGLNEVYRRYRGEIEVMTK